MIDENTAYVKWNVFWLWPVTSRHTDTHARAFTSETFTFEPFVILGECNFQSVLKWCDYKMQQLSSILVSTRHQMQTTGFKPIK